MGGSSDSDAQIAAYLPRDLAEQTLDGTLPYEESWHENATNVVALSEIVQEYVEHGSWRCQYRTRYGSCMCGLDERLAALGLPPCGYDDPEAKS